MALNTTEMELYFRENGDPGDEDKAQAEGDRMAQVWRGVSQSIITDCEYYPKWPKYQPPNSVEGTYSYRFKITVL